MSDTVVVFDYRPLSMILELGGSQAWSLKPINAVRCQFLVVTRNRYGKKRPEPEPHGTPILVGKNLRVEPWPDAPGRFIIRFAEYALVRSETPVWPGHQNPVWYTDIRSLPGIDLDALNWQPVSKVGRDESSNVSPDEAEFVDHGGEVISGMTFDQARTAIATRYGVPPENVEILIRG